MDLEKLEQLVADLREAIEEDASVEALHKVAMRLSGEAHAIEYVLRMEVVGRASVERLKSFLPQLAD